MPDGEVLGGTAVILPSRFWSSLFLPTGTAAGREWQD
jgi:hypothetical protein